MIRAGIVFVALLVAAPAAAQKIVIDPGHGGVDPGGTGTGMQEKEIVLDICKRFRDLLVADTADTAGGGSWTVSLTRDNDTYVALAARASYANSLGADRFMSIHSNAFGDASANGTETFAFAEGGNGAALRNLVQEEMIAAWGLRNRGNKTANFAVLRETTMPAELHELAFITNATDAAKLASDAQRQKAAVAHLRAIQRHFGITPYVPGAMPDPGTEGDIEGIVSAPDGPLAGVEVAVDGEPAGTSGDDGTFAIAGVMVGVHLVSAYAEGYVPVERQVTVAAGVATSVDLFMEPDIPGDDPGDDPSPPGGGDPADDGDQDRLEGGCAAGGNAAGAGAAALALLALCVTRRRRGRDRRRDRGRDRRRDR